MIHEGFTIFYTDDDADDREFFINAAEDIATGVNINTQSNGRELLEVLHNPPPSPNLLFLDLNMPGKNGFEVLKEIRLSEKTKDIPVVILSTSDDHVAIQKTKALGANLYITKPTSYKSLKQMIKHSLSIDWGNFMPSAEEFVYRVN